MDHSQPVLRPVGHGPAYQPFSIDGGDDRRYQSRHFGGFQYLERGHLQVQFFEVPPARGHLENVVLTVLGRDQKVSIDLGRQLAGGPANAKADLGQRGRLLGLNRRSRGEWIRFHRDVPGLPPHPETKLPSCILEA